MKQVRDQLGPAQFAILGRLIPNMFEPGDEIEPERGPRGGNRGGRLVKSGDHVPATVLRGLVKSGLVDGELRPTQAGTNLYLRSLLERKP